MSEVNIMLVCSAGMSTSMLVKSMKKEIEKKDLEVNVFAKTSTEAIEYAEDEEVNVLLLGPQVSFMESGFNESLEDKDISIAVIDARDYGMMNGEKILQQALDLVNKR